MKEARRPPGHHAPDLRQSRLYQGPIRAAVERIQDQRAETSPYVGFSPDAPWTIDGISSQVVPVSSSPHRRCSAMKLSVRHEEVISSGRDWRVCQNIERADPSRGSPAHVFVSWRYLRAAVPT